MAEVVEPATFKAVVNDGFHTLLARKGEGYAVEYSEIGKGEFRHISFGVTVWLLIYGVVKCPAPVFLAVADDKYGCVGVIHQLQHLPVFFVRHS